MNGKKMRFISEYVITGSISKASEAAGVEPATSWIWRKRDPEFRAELTEALDRAYNSTKDSLVSCSGAVVEKALEHAFSDDKNLSLRACLELLKIALRVKEGDEIESRLRALEAEALRRRIDGI